jgi:hypothetical protein
MKRLIEIANKQIEEYLLSLVGTEQGKHLIVEDIQDHKFNCMGTEINWKDVPDNLDLEGFEIKCINVLYEDCVIRIQFSEYRNFINIKIPKWIQHSIFEARMQGQEVTIEALTKLTEENRATKLERFL